MKTERVPLPKPSFSTDIITFFDTTFSDIETFAESESREIDEGEWVAIENSMCRMELCLTEDDTLEIRAIKVFVEGKGVARKIVEGLISFAEENEVSLQATDVAVDAESFWQRMGFEPDSSDVWHHNNSF